MQNRSTFRSNDHKSVGNGIYNHVEEKKRKIYIMRYYYMI